MAAPRAGSLALSLLLLTAFHGGCWADLPPEVGGSDPTDEDAMEQAGQDDPAGEPGYEWAGLFETPDLKYMWIAQAVDGVYADASMKMVILPAAAATETTLQDLEPDARELLGGPCIEVAAGGSLLPGAKCYELIFNNSLIEQEGRVLPHEPGTAAMFCESLDSTFVIAAGDASHLAFFAQHVPTEFERSQHYLKDDSGGDIEPVAEMNPFSSGGKPWALAIGAALIINLVTLVGVLMLIPVFATVVNKYPSAFAVITNSFAAGALLAAAFFLLLYEATHLIAITEERPESAASAAWGCMILLGFITAPLIEVLMHIALMITGAEGGKEHQVVASIRSSQASEYAAEDDKKGAKAPLTGGDGKKDSKETLANKDEALSKQEGLQLLARQRRIIGGILVGDFMHNFCDGFFVGAAFNVCGPAMGWTVASATVYHEIAQEIADFWVLTDAQQGAMSPWLALSLNFISGTSVVLGVLVVLGLDVSNYATGLILAYGGGVYVHIAASECIGRVYSEMCDLSLRITWLAAFFAGAAAIGLVLLDHKHCSADGHGHGH